jgi:hypothetical protein
MYFRIYSTIFLQDKLKIQELCANSQQTMAVVIRNMRFAGRNVKIWAGPISTRLPRDISLQCLILILCLASLRRTTSKDSGTQLEEIGIVFLFINYSIFQEYTARQNQLPDFFR